MTALLARLQQWMTPIQADVSIFFNFVPPPYGGGNQFLRALWTEWLRGGLRLENNHISSTTRACLYNSFNVDPYRLRRRVRTGCRMVHRVDGPVGAYRGTEDTIDRDVWALNQEFAAATIFQSAYSLRAHTALGLTFTDPYVIPNAVDPSIFWPHAQHGCEVSRKIRLISTSWSDNPKKGADTYRWLDDHLDWDRYDYTFVGRSSVAFRHIRYVPPVDSTQLADLLRAHDIYVTASWHDPCSNALLEALSCGLPAVYRDSGGHAELVGQAGLAFTEHDEIPAQIARVVNDYGRYRAQIQVPTIGAVADRYLQVMHV